MITRRGLEGVSSVVILLSTIAVATIRAVQVVLTAIIAQRKPITVKIDDDEISVNSLAELESVLKRLAQRNKSRSEKP